MLTAVTCLYLDNLCRYYAVYIEGGSAQVMVDFHNACFDKMTSDLHLILMI